MLKNYGLKIAVLGLLVLLFSGCAAVPIMQSLEEMGATEKDRMVLLQKQVNDYYQLIYWGKPYQALADFVQPELHPELKKTFRTRKRAKEKIVESKIEMVDFAEEATIAEVEVAVQYYAVPRYVVSERLEAQRWEFVLGDGWKLSSYEEIPLT